MDDIIVFHDQIENSLTTLISNFFLSRQLQLPIATEPASYHEIRCLFEDQSLLVLRIFPRDLATLHGPHVDIKGAEIELGVSAQPGNPNLPELLDSDIVEDENDLCGKQNQ